jgi:biopolymer transport protein ExbD
MRLVTVGPGADGARAQLLFALLILALLPVTLISSPRPNHGLTFELGMIPEELTPGMSRDQAGWVRPFVRSTARFAVSDISDPLPDPSAPRHRLDLLPSGQLLFDKRPVDRSQLRRRLDLLMTMARPGWVDFRPDPNARYEDFVETLAPVAYSAFDRLRLDNSRYATAFEAAMAKERGS